MISSKPRPVPAPELLRTHVYSRFIPREELGAFAPWRPGDIAGGPTPQANVLRAPNPSTAPAPPARAAVTAQAASAADDSARAARQAGYQAGYRDGLVALEGFKASAQAQTAAQVGALLASVGTALDGMQQDMARSLAITATHLARQIVRAELAAHPELIARVAQEALDTLLLSARHITLHVHPDDHPLVALGAADVLAARGARLLADANVPRGGCQLESDIGVIDASLDARWRRAVASIGVDAGWDTPPPSAAAKAQAHAQAPAEFDADDDADADAELDPDTAPGGGVDTDLGAYDDALVNALPHPPGRLNR